VDPCGLREAVAKRIMRFLRIPYETRSPDTALATLRNYTARIECGGKHVYVIGFVDRSGVKSRYYVCIGNRLELDLVDEEVYDVMSGLRHRVSVPVIRIDGCVIKPRWERSRFVYDRRVLSTCSKCQVL
jgi:hypothetical protein